MLLRIQIQIRIEYPLRKSHMLPTCEPRVFHMGTHVFHIKAHIFHIFSQNVINCPMWSTVKSRVTLHSTWNANACTLFSHSKKNMWIHVEKFNPIRSGLFQTVNDPGGGGFKSPPPPTISKTIVSIFTISYMWILRGVFGMIQLEFFENSRFWPFYSDFKMKSIENSCKINIFVVLFKIDFKYTKRRRILMRI